MARYGSQTPTSSKILPYKLNRSKRAISLYRGAKRKEYPWQAEQMKHILAVNRQGLWVHTKYGLQVPRRNGKNEVVVMRELYGLDAGEKICHTAHRTTTSHAAFERLYRILLEAGYTELTRKKKERPDKSFFASKQYGLESIELTGGGTIVFRTRTNNGGLGEGFDLLVIDEAQEYSDKQQSALIYTVSDSKNPQTIFCGTPPTATSGGDVFRKMRESITAGMSEDTGWAEWSIDEKTDDIRDVDLWYKTNPSLGYILTERKIRSEITDDIVDFNIQRLGLWLTYSQKSAISAAEWNELRSEQCPQLEPRLFLGVKYGHDGTNAALAVAAKTVTGEIFVEVAGIASVRAGNGWMMDYFRNPHVEKIVIDGAKGQLLADEMKELRLQHPIRPTVKEIIVANTMFEQGVFERSIRHTGQPSLAAAVSNCDKRMIGQNGGFGYRSIDDAIDIALMDAVILAHWACATTKARQKQQMIV